MEKPLLFEQSSLQQVVTVIKLQSTARARLHGRLSIHAETWRKAGVRVYFPRSAISAKYYGQSVVKVVADLEYMISVMFVTGDEDWCESECDPTTRTATRTSKKSIGLISKTTTSHVRHAFLHISFLFFTTTTWKCLILRLKEDLNKQRRNFISLFELGYGSLKFSFRRVRLHLTK